MIKKRLVVLISGNGSNLQAIIDACANQILNAEVVAVIANKADAYGLLRAKNAGIPAIVHPFHKGGNRTAYDHSLAELVLQYKPDFVLLAGWMRILSQAFLCQFPGKVINIHPALPGKFPGVHAIDRAYAAYQQGLIKKTGVMVHFVPDEGVDNGPLICQEAVEINSKDTNETLEERIHQVEHRLFIDALQIVCNQT
jgi:phosphoribosylglycinamide formyltransferase 1